jgi:hypothetical protein
MSQTTTLPMDNEWFKNSTLYNFADNPAAAWDNVLRDMGYNPYAANPFMQQIRQAAPGMANSYLVNQAMIPRPGTPGGQPTGLQGLTQDMGLGYRDFAKNALGAGGGGSSIYATLQQGANNLRPAVNVIRGLGTDTENAVNMNPYAWLLNQNLAANNGQGTTEYLASLNGPMLGSANLRRAYGTGLQSSYAGAMRNYASSANPLYGDIYNYLLGY